MPIPQPSRPKPEPLSDRPAGQRTNLAAKTRRLIRLGRGIHAGAIHLPDLLEAVQDTAQALEVLTHQFLVGERYQDLRDALAWMQSEAFLASRIPWLPVVHIRPTSPPNVPAEVRYTVPSSNGINVCTIIHRATGQWVCTCRNWTIHRLDCKHIREVHARPTWYPFQPPPPAKPRAA